MSSLGDARWKNKLFDTERLRLESRLENLLPDPAVVDRLPRYISDTRDFVEGML